MGYTYKDVVKAFWSKKNRKGGGWCGDSKRYKRYYYCDNGSNHYRDQVVVGVSDVIYLFHGQEIARLEGEPPIFEIPDKLHRLIFSLVKLRKKLTRELYDVIMAKADNIRTVHKLLAPLLVEDKLRSFGE